VKFAPFIEFGGILTRNEGFGKGFWAHRGTPILQSGLAAVEMSGLWAEGSSLVVFIVCCAMTGKGGDNAGWRPAWFAFRSSLGKKKRTVYGPHPSLI
jgi:hypothetical protein